MQYLMIQNQGVAPVEAYTTLGVSTTRFDKKEQTIGQFGSGCKQSINLLLRNQFEPTIFCGLTQLKFYTKELPVNDGLISHDFNKVYCRLSGKTEDATVNRTIDCGWTTEYGVQDWTTIDMALREFVSNAIDRTLREEGEFVSASKDGRLCVKVVDENQVRAKAGCTRVFLPYRDEIIIFHSQLGRRFLHFSTPELLSQKILPKNNRNLSNKKVAVIYLNGVFVREIESENTDSLFDYNLSSNELKLDESRRVDDWRVKSAVSQLVRDASVEELATVFKTLVKFEKPYWEHNLDRDYLSANYLYTAEEKADCSARWKTAWAIAAGDGIICRRESYFTEMIQKRGFSAIGIPDSANVWLHAAEQHRVPSALDIMTASERKGRAILPATPAAQEAVNTVWNWLREVNLTLDKTIPQVKCFRDILQAGTKTVGYYERGFGGGEPTVFINEDAATSGVHKDLLHTALEEVSHHVTGSTDFSRDFQNFLLQAIVEIKLANATPGRKS